MTKSELIENLTMKFNRLPHPKVERSVNAILELMSKALADERRIEIRGFGSFSLKQSKEKQGRNPLTGESVQVKAKKYSHFKPGKELRERVNATMK